VKYANLMTMLKLEFIDGELFYLVFTNKGNNLILMTRDGRLAMQTNAALKNKKDDSYFRVNAVRDRKKAAW
jgi:flagellar basal body rod protein FlgG